MVDVDVSPRTPNVAVDQHWSTAIDLTIRRLLDGPAAVYDQRRAGHEVRRVRNQEQRRPDHLPRVGDVAERRPGLAVGRELLVRQPGRRQGRSREARAEGV